MNIKYIVNVRIPTPRAQGYAIMKMCEQFFRAGARVELIVPDRKNNESEEDPFVYYGMEKSFPIRRMFSFDLLGSTLRFGQLFYWIDIVSFFISLKFANLVNKSDVIYTRDFTIALLFSKKRFVCLELHDIPKSQFLFRLAIKKPKLFFVLNENIKQELVSLGVHESIIHIAPSGVDLDEFDITDDKNEARKKVGLPQDKKIVMYTGHLYKWKGIDTIGDMAIQMPDVQFVFVGGVDPEFTEYKEKYKDHNNIVLLPFVQRGIVPYYLKAADALVIPYSQKEDITSRYTSPLKLFEYMASKRPIVSSNLSSIRQILDEKTAVFADPGDVESFTRAIKKVLLDEQLGKKLAENAYNTVLQYSWDKRAGTILNIIQRS